MLKVTRTIVMIVREERPFFIVVDDLEVVVTGTIRLCLWNKLKNKLY